MNAPLSRISTILLAVFAVLVGTGCAMPSQVRAPRLLEAGHFEHSVGGRLATSPALERSDVSFGLDIGEDYNPVGLSPAYSLRYGALEWLEVGAEIQPTHLRLESAVRILESRALDLTLGIDGGVHSGAPGDDATSYFTAAVPLTAGLNVHRNVTLIGMAAPAVWSNDAFVQVGGGIDLRLGSVSLRPTFAQLLPLGSDSPKLVTMDHDRSPRFGTGTFYLLGLDVAFGGSRRYETAGIF